MSLTAVLILWFPMCCLSLQGSGGQLQLLHQRLAHRPQLRSSAPQWYTTYLSHFRITWSFCKEFLGPIPRISLTDRVGPSGICIKGIELFFRWPSCTASLRHSGPELLALSLGRRNWELLCSGTSGCEACLTPLPSVSVLTRNKEGKGWISKKRNYNCPPIGKEALRGETIAL